MKDLFDLSLAHLRKEITWWKLLVVGLLILGPVALAIPKITTGVFRDNLDLLGVTEVTPLVLVFPLVVVLIACTGFYSEMGNRYILATRSRVSVQKYLGARLVATFVVGFSVGVVSVTGPLVMAFVIWPAIGNPFIDPTAYGLSPHQAVVDSYSRSSFSELMVFGPVAYGGFHAAWVGLAGGVYAVLGILLLAIVHRRTVALLIPFTFYIAQAVVVTLAGDAHLALMFCTFTYGLGQDTLKSLLVISVLVILVLAALVVTLRRAPDLSRLR